MNELEKKYIDLLQRYRKINKRYLDKLEDIRRKIVAIGCSHFDQTDEVRERGDGFGSRVKIPYKHCKICNHVNFYGHWSTSDVLSRRDEDD